MCGILFLSTSNGQRALKPIIKRYEKQKERGKEGFGFVSIDNRGYIGKVVRATKEADILAELRRVDAHTIMLHHRFPTSTPNYAEAAHPLKISDARYQHDYYVIHNGVIRNASTLFERQKKDGSVFMTEILESYRHTFVNTGEYYDFEDATKFNDSEAFAIDLANLIECRQSNIEAYGTISFIAIQTEKSGKVVAVYYGHNDGNPLIEENDKTLFCLRSLGKGGGMRDVPTNKIYRLDWNTKEITYEEVTIGWVSSANDYANGYAKAVYVPSRSHPTSQDDHDYNDDIKNFGFDATKVTTDSTYSLFRVLNLEHPLLADGSMKSPITIEDVMWTDKRKLPVIRYDDEIEDFVGRVIPRHDDDDSERLKDLRRQLRDARIADETAWQDLEVAKSLVATSHNGKHNVEERDTALAMLEVAKKVYRDTHAEVICLEVELTG